MTKVIPLQDLLTVHKNKQFLPNYQRFREVLNGDEHFDYKYKKLAKKLRRDYSCQKVDGSKIVFKPMVFRVLRKCYKKE